MDGRKGQFVVLHGVHLAAQQVGGEVETAGHRQAGILQAIAQLLGHQEAVGAGADHHMAGPDPAGRRLATGIAFQVGGPGTVGA